MAGDQGTFTPGADPNAVPLPIAGASAYQHGQWWTSTADGFVAGRNVYRNERIWAILYADPSGLHTADAMEFEPEATDGRRTLNCNELSIKIGFSDPGVVVADRDVTMTEINEYTRGFILRRGRTTNWFDTPIATMQIEVDDSTGFFSRNVLDADPFLRKGAPIEVDATYRGATFPLFRGKLLTLTEPARPDINTIIMTFQDFTYDLAAPIKGKWSPGDTGDEVHDRIEKILAKSLHPLTDFTRWNPSNFTLTNYASQRTLLDEIALSCMSSGCAFFYDNDGTPVLLNETRLSGRAGRPPLWTDACSPNSPNMSYNEIDTAWADAEFGNNILVNNVSQGNDVQVEKTAKDQASIDLYGLETWAHPQLVICNVDRLQALADWELERRKDAFYRVTRMRFAPVNNDRAFFVGLEMQLGDALYINRTPTASESTLNAAYVVEGLQISATGTSWSFDLFVSPAKYIGDRKYGDFNYGDLFYGGALS